MTSSAFCAAPGHAHVEQVMGMPVSIDIRDEHGPAGRAAIDEVVAWLHLVDDKWSTYRDDSGITRFARGQLRTEDLPEDMDRILDDCEALRIETAGAFDIHIPAPNGTMLEPSGYIKGWAIERAAELIELVGGRNFCINAGGDVVMRGEAAPSTPWSVGIRHPDYVDQFADVLQFTGAWAVATSATYERGNHIVDPRTGRPANEVRSATVVGPDLTRVDVYATTLFVTGLDGLALLLDQPGYDAFLITHNNECISTPGFDQHRLAQSASAATRPANSPREMKTP